MPDSALSSEARALAPTGVLRTAIAVGPAASAMWAMRDPASGKPRGVTLDLAAAMAGMLHVPVHYAEYESSGRIVEAAQQGVWDITFVPVDAERKKLVAFGPNYVLGESTYMVSSRCGVTTLEEIDRPGIDITGVEGTATLRSARRTTKQAQVRGVVGLDEAVTLFEEGKTDALALGRETLRMIVGRFPGARVLDGAFHATGTAVAVPPGRLEALEVASALLEKLKADGTVRALLDRHGLEGATLAPPGSMS